MRRSLLLFIFCLFIFPVFALAQGAGLTLKPATIEGNINPGETKKFSLTIKNETENEQLYYLDRRDIVGVRDGNVPVFADKNLEETGLELSEWISLPVTSVVIPAFGEQLIEITIVAPENATPGSHFAGIFASVDAPEIRESGAAIGYEVANIISLRVAGDVLEKAEIRQFSTDNYIYGSQNVDFNVHVQNLGNTLIRPIGPVEITNMFGKKVNEKLLFNDSSAGVFPGVTREFSFSWKGDESRFGRYEAVLSAAYGEEGAKQTMSSTVTFWILPMNIIGPSLGVLLFVLLTIFIVTKLYIRRKLAMYQATSGRRLVRQNAAPGTPLLMMLMVMLTVTALFFIILMILFA